MQALKQGRRQEGVGGDCGTGAPLALAGSAISLSVVSQCQPARQASQPGGGKGGAERGSGICGAHKLSKYVAKRPDKGGERGRNYAVSVTEPVQLVLRANERQVYISYRFKYR